MTQALPKPTTTVYKYNAVLDRTEKPVQFIPDRTKKIGYIIANNPNEKKFFEHIYVTPVAAEAMAEYVRLCKDEISWLATIKEGDGSLTIEDVFLFKQEVSGTTTELDEHGLAEFYSNMLMDPPDGDIEKASDILNRIRCWGHSHVNMGVSPSGTDDRTMQEFCNNVVTTDMPYMVRLIANKKGDMKIDIYYYSRFLVAVDVPWSILSHTTGRDFASQIEALVTKKSYSYQGGAPYSGGYQGGGSNHTSHLSEWTGGSGGTTQKKTDDATGSTGSTNKTPTFHERRQEAESENWEWVN